MSTSFTNDDLIAIEQAIAKGILSVKYTDKEVVYRSLNDMLKTRDFIRKCLGLDNSRGLRAVASTSKGL